MFKSFKRKPKSKTENGQSNENDEDKYTTVKCGLRSIIRPKYRHLIINSIEEKSILSTKICALGSLLLLYKVQNAYDNGRLHREFFTQDGQIVIKECFDAVLVQNINGMKMVQEFREFVENLDAQHHFEWPNNRNFGNGLKHLVKTYATNVYTNLKTHCEKRLINYLKLKVFQSNTASPLVYKYTPKDISSVVNFLIYKKDIQCNSNDDEVKRMRRDMLIQIIQNISWFNVIDDRLFDYNQSNWFKSIPMWIAMQREIDEYNMLRSQSYQNANLQQPPNGNRKQKRPWRREKQMLDNPNDPPEISNLCVIPICDFKRTHYTLDNDALYRLLSQNRILERRGNANILPKEFTRRKDEQWNKYFYMRKIKWFVRRKKEFDFCIRSNGVSVSLQYISPKVEPKPIDLNKIKTEYKNRTVRKVLGVDPGLNKWSSVVQRDIETGKEVRYRFISQYIFVYTVEQYN